MLEKSLKVFFQEVLPLAEPWLEKQKKNYFLSYLFTALYFFKQFKKETGGG